MTPWTVACQASLSSTISQSLLKLMSIESVMPPNHLILCCPLLFLPSINRYILNIYIYIYIYVCVCVCVCVCVYVYVQQCQVLGCFCLFSHSVVSNSLRPCPWDSPGRNIEVGCHFLLQGIFLTQGLNLCLLYYRWILYSLSHRGSLKF